MKNMRVEVLGGSAWYTENIHAISLSYEGKKLVYASVQFTGPLNKPYRHSKINLRLDRELICSIEPEHINFSGERIHIAGKVNTN